MSKFGPLPSQIQWEDELRACYEKEEMHASLYRTDPHLFARETIQIRTLRINAIICGFDKTFSLYKSKVNEQIKDPFYDPDVFIPDYGMSEDEDESATDGYMERPYSEKQMLLADFLKFNVQFWVGIFKYHPVFFHHRCDGWAGSNNSKRISLCCSSSS